jgi:hypothetical protein
MVAWLLALTTLGAALRAAWFWYRSSQVVAVPFWIEVGGDEPQDPQMAQVGWMNAFMKANEAAAYLNRWGALWTAGTVVLGAAAVVAAALSISD